MLVLHKCCAVAAVLILAVSCSSVPHEPIAIAALRISAVETLDHEKLEGTVTADTRFGRVTATTRYRRYNPAHDKHTHHWRGMNGEAPVFVLESIRLTVNGAGIVVPPASYAECGEEFFQSPNLLLYRLGYKLGLSYSGGDGSAAHEILFVVKDGKVTKVYTLDWRARPGRPYPEKAWRRELLP